MATPPPSRFAVVGRSLLVSAATVFAIAFLIYSGTLPIQESSRSLVAGAMVVVGVLDVAIGLFFLRKGRLS